MTDLIAFLRARLDEDEAQMRRQIEAKRQIIQDLEDAKAAPATTASDVAPLHRAVYLLASAHVLHPDYNPWWVDPD